MGKKQEKKQKRGDEGSGRGDPADPPSKKTQRKTIMWVAPKPKGSMGVDHLAVRVMPDRLLSEAANDPPERQVKANRNPVMGS